MLSRLSMLSISRRKCSDDTSTRRMRSTATLLDRASMSSRYVFLASSSYRSLTLCIVVFQDGCLQRRMVINQGIETRTYLLTCDWCPALMIHPPEIKHPVVVCPMVHFTTFHSPKIVFHRICMPCNCVISYICCTAYSSLLKTPSQKQDIHYHLSLTPRLPHVMTARQSPLDD